MQNGPNSNGRTATEWWKLGIRLQSVCARLSRRRWSTAALGCLILTTGLCGPCCSSVEQFSAARRLRSVTSLQSRPKIFLFKRLWLVLRDSTGTVTLIMLNTLIDLFTFYRMNRLYFTASCTVTGISHRLPYIPGFCVCQRHNTKRLDFKNMVSWFNWTLSFISKDHSFAFTFNMLTQIKQSPALHNDLWLYTGK